MSNARLARIRASDMKSNYLLDFRRSNPWELIGRTPITNIIFFFPSSERDYLRYLRVGGRFLLIELLLTNQRIRIHNFCKNVKMSSTPKAVSIRLDHSNVNCTSAKQFSLSWAQKSYCTSCFLERCSLHCLVLKKKQWSRTFVSLICFILLLFCYLYSIH